MDLVERCQEISVIEIGVGTGFSCLALFELRQQRASRGMVLCAIQYGAAKCFHLDQDRWALIENGQGIGYKILDVVRRIGSVPVRSSAPGQRFRAADVVGMTDERWAGLSDEHRCESGQAKS